MRALVVGLAVSGTAAAELLRSQGYDVVGYDATRSAIPPVSGIEVHVGAWRPELLDDVDLVVPSPGVPESAAPIVAALSAGIPVWSELELGARRLRGTRVVAITGTNGKTTTTEMATAMLVASGVDAVAVGNIGDPISGSGAEGHEVVVVEASSFQLRFIESFAPDAAVLLNFAPDHLDWHATVEDYAAAKARVFEHMGETAPLVFDADDAGASDLVGRSRSHRVPVSGHRRIDRSGPEGAAMWLAGVSVPMADLFDRDPAFLVDLAAAAEVASAVGATDAGIESAARSYRPGRHRREVVAVHDGVTWVNDSKATNPHAALAAIAAHPSVVLIAGGRAKGLEIGPLATAPSVRRVVAIGESAGILEAARPDVLTADSMEDAVELAAGLARPGDVVLLAPGCASFDMFDSYGHRGDVFVAAVRRRIGGA